MTETNHVESHGGVSRITAFRKRVILSICLFIVLASVTILVFKENLEDKRQLDHGRIIAAIASSARTGKIYSLESILGERDFPNILLGGNGRIDLNFHWTEPGQKDDVNAQATEFNPITFAIIAHPNQERALEVVKRLVEGGANVNQCAGQDSLSCPIGATYLYGFASVRKYLIRAGAIPRGDERPGSVFAKEATIVDPDCADENRKAECVPQESAKDFAH